MATFTFTIPDNEAARIAQAVCQSQGHGPSSPEDAVEFTKEYVFRHLARIVIEQEAALAAQAARDAVWSNPDDPLAMALLVPVVEAPELSVDPVGPTGPQDQ